jgi:two-component sensor histidine kinase
MGVRDIEWFPKLRNHRLVAYLMSVLAVGTATLITHLIPPLHEAPTDLYFAAIVATAWLGGRGPAILATILSTLAVDFFIIPPIFSILIDLSDVIRFAIFAFVAMLICSLQEGYQRAAIRLREANSVLEARVRERTAELATANKSLLREIQEKRSAAAALIESESKLRLALGHTEMSLKDKEILIRELNHRVKNNLQIITSLLSLQRSRLEDPASRELFKECQNRVRAIALVHQRLCGAANLANIDLAAYFQQLVQELHSSYCGGNGTISPRVEVDEMSLNIDHLIPCALIVNELVCNAFKYAFPQGQSGQVCVDVHRKQGQVSLTVADDGIGFSPCDPLERKGVGLQIVQALVDQLSGKIEWANGRGTSATVSFPAVV